MLKKIVVPTDGYKASTVSIDYAIDIAKLFNAEIIGLSVVDIKRLAKPFIQDLGTSVGGMMPFVNFKDTFSEMLNSVADTALTLLEERCNEKSVPCTTNKQEGVITSEINKCAADAELIAMGRTGEHSNFTNGLLGSNLESIVRLTKKPILVASETFVKISKILVAYDGSEYAGKALKMSGEIASKMGVPMTIMTVGDNQKKTSDIVFNAIEYIKPFKLEFNTIVEDGDPVDVIYKNYIDGGFNMVVMGAYGHSKIRELIVGSATVQLMRRIDCPMLISR